ncbi:MAG TPA: 30S ribosomal protein S12 methylthiotransferase RimO [Clostridiales bacterium]|nr:30S ribosomal protein S12 methylthiotransferase RimO [Clostridiales bacterium]
MRIGFISLGCPKNRIDTEIMLHEVLSAGYEVTPDETEADIVVINTCAFVEDAKRESIDNILDVAMLKENRRLKGIIVTGCLSERYRDRIFDELPEVDALLGVGSIHNIVRAIDAVSAQSKREPKLKYSSFESCDSTGLGGDRILTTPDHWAYLKVAEGCDNRCAYCAIPYIRGPFRSRPMEDIIKEAKELEALGVRELSLVAQDTTRYGLDLYGKPALPTLLRALSEKTSIPWIRLLYCYPDLVTDELVDELRDNPRVLKYIDLPIQHISDRVLSSMNRRGGSAAVRNSIAKLREKIPSIVLRTTFITGFPGETEEDFAGLCEFVKETKFDRAGVFPFSREEDTPAYNFPGQIDDKTKQDRVNTLMELQQKISRERNRSMIGKTLTVLCEGYDEVGGIHYGRSEADAPEIDGFVFFHADKRIKPGSFVRVTVTEVLDYDLVGRAGAPQSKGDTV